MLYVSRGPWSIYEVLERFFRRHRIPVGPIPCGERGLRRASRYGGVTSVHVTPVTV
jgi:phosphatidate phosphatase APP1